MRENNLARFIKAQESDYKTALAEIKSGHKRSCWMWYIFPQIQGLGSSGTAMYYAIEDYEEAKAYITKLKLNKEKLINLGGALGINIARATKKDNIIAMIVEGSVGNRLKIEGIRKGIIG